MSVSGSSMAKSLLDLPVELLTNIFEYLPHPLAPYSTISRDFQFLVESITFKDVHFLGTQLPKIFNTLFSPRHRRYALKTLRITLTPVLHDENHEQGTRISWGQAIGYLLRELNCWEKEDVTGNLKARPTILDLILHTDPCMIGNCAWDLIWEALGDTVPIEDVANLPPVFFVQGLLYWWGCSLCWSDCSLGHVQPVTIPCLDPVDLIQLSTKFPGLRSLALDGVDMGQSFTRIPEILGKSQVKRVALSKYIHRLPEMNTRLTSLRLGFCEDSINNHAFVPLSLVPSTTNGTREADPLSLALHAMSRECVNLRSLSILGDAIVGPELFWPDPSPSSVSQNRDLIWPNLERYDVVIHEIAPDGQWYSGMPPHAANTYNEVNEEEDGENLDQYNDTIDCADPKAIEWKSMAKWVTLRTHFNEAKFIPLLRAVTNAINHMPKIQEFSLIIDNDELFEMIARNIGIPSVCTHPVSCQNGDCYNISRRSWYTFLGWAEKELPEDIENGWKMWVGENGSVLIRHNSPDW